MSNSLKECDRLTLEISKRDTELRRLRAQQVSSGKRQPDNISPL